MTERGFIDGFVMMTNDILVPRLKKEFGVKRSIPRKGIMEHLIVSKYVVTYDKKLYDIAWGKLEYKIMRESAYGRVLDKKTMKRLVDETIKEMKS